MDVTLMIAAFTTLFVVIDPIGLAPIFVALTQGMPPAQRHAIATRACLLAVGILLLFGFLGEAVLSFIGISMGAFQISGGILLFITALQMLFEERTRKRREKGAAAVEDDTRDPSVFPLAIPLIAGPGAIAAMILLMGEAAGGLINTAIVLSIMCSVVMLVWLFFLSAGVIERLLGATGIVVVTRLLGMLLAA
ncbi:MAG: MarC family protein, partial [Pseudomonadota bacterium]